MNGLELSTNQKRSTLYHAAIHSHIAGKAADQDVIGGLNARANVYLAEAMLRWPGGFSFSVDRLT